MGIMHFHHPTESVVATAGLAAVENTHPQRGFSLEEVKVGRLEGWKKAMSKQHDREAISVKLQELEDELKALMLWGGDEQRPHEKLAQPLGPFGVGDIEFHQWLEYVLLPNFRQIIAEKRALPEFMAVHPYAIEYYRNQWLKYRKLISILKELDHLISLKEELAAAPRGKFAVQPKGQGAHHHHGHQHGHKGKH